MNDDDLRKLVKCLLELKRVSGSKLATLLGYRRQNVNRWLAGYPGALSFDRKLALLDTLGVRDGCLKPATSHYWFTRDHKKIIYVLRSLQIRVSNVEMTDCRMYKVNAGSPTDQIHIYIEQLVGLEPPTTLTKKLLNEGI